MEPWLSSIYSDGTAMFVSNPEPDYGETVTIRMRVTADAPVDHVVLRYEPNGVEHHIEMQRTFVRHGLAYYEAPFTMTEKRMRYRFYIVSGDRLYYYNQAGASDCNPDVCYDFQILTDYRQPSWVKKAVFYQIFPERFCNGDPSNDVQDGEITIDGHSSLHMKWTDTPLPYEKGFCMDFFGGDLDGIRQKIPYLKSLGVTALYLNPIFIAPSVHKYDCIDYFHVDPHFGGDEALARLSRALHENGLKLILDISINHTGTANRWFNRDGLYFDKSEGAYNNPDSVERSYYFFQPGTNEYKGWDGLPSMPVLNYSSAALRDAIYRAPDSVIRKFLKPPYSIDGWRFDVADVFARNNEIQLADEVWPELCSAIREENPEAYILAEDWGDCTQRLQGDDYDSPMNYFGCQRIILQFFGGIDHFFDRTPALNAHAFYVDAKQVKARITNFLGKMPCVISQNMFNLLDSHDVTRVQHAGYMNEERVRGAVMLMFLLPGAPNVYYGDEAEIGGWEGSIEGCRFPMPWDKDIEHTEAYHFYHELITLKREHNCLSDGGMKFLFAEGQVLSLARFDETEAIICAVSASNKKETCTLRLADIGAAFSNQKEDLFGHRLDIQTQANGDITLTLNPGEAVLLHCPMK